MVGAGTGRRMTRPGGRVARRPESGIRAPIVSLQAALLPQRAPGRDTPRGKRSRVEGDKRILSTLRLRRGGYCRFDVPRQQCSPGWMSGVTALISRHHRFSSSGKLTRKRAERNCSTRFSLGQGAVKYCPAALADVECPMLSVKGRRVVRKVIPSWATEASTSGRIWQPPS